MYYITGSESGVARGAYILKDCDDPAVILIATGSEVSLALAATKELENLNIKVRVVSAPCLEWFAEQDASYRALILPKAILKVSIEAGVAQGWREIIGDSGIAISLERYGASAAGSTIFKNLGFSVENVVAKVKVALP